MNPLEICEEDKLFVREELGLTEEDIKRDVEILKDWIKKQPHLPQGIQDDVFFENFLIRSKGRVEKAKRTIDSYYSVKTVWPEIYENLQDYPPSRIPLDVASTLTLTNDKERIFNMRFYENPEEDFNMLELVKVFFAQLEVLSKYDYCSGVRLVVDCSNYKLDHVKITAPNLLKKCLTAFTDVYSYRFRGVHYYRPPAWFGLFLNILKSVLKAKIYERIHLHNDLESLTKIVPREYLPAHLGGEESIEELKEQWNKIIKDHKDYLEEVPRLKSNEKLRIGECQFDPEMFGIDGTFKKLNID